ERWRLASRPTHDLDAYNLYLLGRHHFSKVTAADFEKALDYFGQAIARDPRFARAYASLAEVRLYLGLGYWGVRPHDMLPQVGQLAEQALSLDPHCAEAHMSLAIYLEWYEYRWREAAAAFEHAVELNPSSSSIRLYYAIHLVAVGRWDDANSHRELACQLD